MGRNEKGDRQFWPGHPSVLLASSSAVVGISFIGLIW